MTKEQFSQARMVKDAMDRVEDYGDNLIDSLRNLTFLSAECLNYEPFRDLIDEFSQKVKDRKELLKAELQTRFDQI